MSAHLVAWVLVVSMSAEPKHSTPDRIDPADISVNGSMVQEIHASRKQCLTVAVKKAMEMWDQWTEARRGRVLSIAPRCTALPAIYMLGGRADTF